MLEEQDRNRSLQEQLVEAETAKFEAEREKLGSTTRDPIFRLQDLVDYRRSSSVLDIHTTKLIAKFSL